MLPNKTSDSYVFDVVNYFALSPRELLYFLKLISGNLKNKTFVYFVYIAEE
jgi:hypothetical protein